MRPAASLALVALVPVALGGCHGPCGRVAHARAAATARPAAAPGPHLRVRVPFALVNRLVADALVDRPVYPVELASLGPLRPLIGALSVVPRDVRLGPASPGHVRLTVALELRGPTGPIVTLTAGGELDPTIERDGDAVAVSLGLDPSRVDELALDLGPGLASRLGDVLAAYLPDRVRSTVPRFVIDQVAAAVAEELVTVTWSALRRTVLPAVGELTRVRFALPPVPAESIELTSTTGDDGALVLGLTTALPVRATAPEPWRRADAITVAAPGSALAELGNWAVASGQAPTRYARSLEPDEDGDFVPRFDWRPDHPRPLVVDVDRVRGGCEWYAVGVAPTLLLSERGLVAGARERTFEQVLGPAYLRAAAWLKSLLQGAVSKKVASRAVVTVGGRTALLTLRDVALDDDGLDLAVEAAIAPP